MRVAGLPVRTSRLSTFVRVVVLRTKEDVARERLPGAFFAAIVVFVQVIWAAALVYFGVRFL